MTKLGSKAKYCLAGAGLLTAGWVAQGIVSGLQAQFTTWLGAILGILGTLVGTHTLTDVAKTPATPPTPPTP